MKIKINKTRDDAVIPVRGSNGAAGYDLCIPENIKTFTLKPGATIPIPLGITLEIPHGYFGAIYARSGLGCKHNITPANCVGVIDEDYRGEIIVALHNESTTYDEQLYAANTMSFTGGDRIAQLIIQKYEEIEFETVDSLSDTERGAGGFGSTGKGM